METWSQNPSLWSFLVIERDDLARLHVVPKINSFQMPDFFLADGDDGGERGRPNGRNPQRHTTPFEKAGMRRASLRKNASNKCGEREQYYKSNISHDVPPRIVVCLRDLASA